MFSAIPPLKDYSKGSLELPPPCQLARSPTLCVPEIQVWEGCRGSRWSSMRGDNRTGVTGLIDRGQDVVGVSSLALERHWSCAELLLRSPVSPNLGVKLLICLEKRLMTVF